MTRHHAPTPALTQEEMAIAWGGAKRAQSDIAREKAASLERSRERAAAVDELQKKVQERDDPAFDTPEGGRASKHTLAS